MESKTHKYVSLAGQGDRGVLFRDGMIEIEGYWKGGQPSRLFLWNDEAIELAQEILRNVEIKQRPAISPDQIQIGYPAPPRRKKRKWPI